VKFQYPAKLISVVDGDTVDLQVDLGFRMTIRDRFRLYGINAPEIRGHERARGLAAKVFLKELLADQDINLHTHKDRRGKYGRWLATLIVAKGNVNELLVANNHAVYRNY